MRIPSGLNYSVQVRVFRSEYKKIPNSFLEDVFQKFESFMIRGIFRMKLFMITVTKFFLIAHYHSSIK